MATSPVPDDRLRQQFEELLALPEADPHAAILRELVGAVFRLNENRLETLDLKILNRALKEMRYAFRLFRQYRNRRKVAVFGSARMPSENPLYDLARRFARRLAEHGYMVITGAGGGIMRAANEGAGRENSFGLNILLPFEQEPNPAIAGDPLDRAGGSGALPGGLLGRGRCGRDRGILPTLPFQPVRERAAGAAPTASFDGRASGRPQRAVCPLVPGRQDRAAVRPPGGRGRARTPGAAETGRALRQ